MIRRNVCRPLASGSPKSSRMTWFPKPSESERMPSSRVATRLSAKMPFSSCFNIPSTRAASTALSSISRTLIFSCMIFTLHGSSFLRQKPRSGVHHSHGDKFFRSERCSDQREGAESGCNGVPKHLLNWRHRTKRRNRTNRSYNNTRHAFLGKRLAVSCPIVYILRKQSKFRLDWNTNSQSPLGPTNSALDERNHLQVRCCSPFLLNARNHLQPARSMCRKSPRAVSHVTAASPPRGQTYSS